MKGHLRERGKGNWYAVLNIHDPATGKRRRKWHSLDARGKREAQDECARLIAELNGGTYLEPSKTTLAQFLERWLRHIKTQITPKSHERYSQIVKNQINPALGSVILSKLKPIQISEAYAAALERLAPASVIYMHRVLKHALGQAVRWRMLLTNPAEQVDPPKKERRAMTTYDMTQTAELIEFVRSYRLFVPVVLAALCGLRRGEIVALRWRHIDFEAASIAVMETAEQTAEGVRYKEPKSGRARAVAMLPFVVEALRQHRITQAEEMLRLGIRPDESTFVYTKEDGSPLQPRSLTRAWDAKIATSTGLPHFRFHDLRHAHATHMLASGVHPKIASERLGHSTVGITLDLYSHVLPGMQSDAVTRVDDALQQALQKRAREIG
jgi:integrase